MRRIAQEFAREQPTASRFQSLRRWTSRLSCLLVWGAGLLVAAACVGALIIDRRVPRPRGADSVRPWLPRDGGVDVGLYVTLSPDREAVREQPTVILRNITGDVIVTVPVPAETRLRGAKLWAHVCVRPTQTDTEYYIGAARLTSLLRRIRPRADAIDEAPPGTAPFWRFKDYPLVLRLLDVGGDGALDAAGLEGDGLRRLGVEIDVQRRDGEDVYMPVAFIDDGLALRAHAKLLSLNVSTPAPPFLFRLVWAAPLTFVVRRGIRDNFQILAARIPESLVDLLRWEMRDESAARRGGLLALKFAYAGAYMYLLDTGADRVLRERTAYWILGVILGIVTASYIRGIALFAVVTYCYSRPVVHRYRQEATTRLYAATLPLLLAGVPLYSYLYDVRPAYYSVLTCYFGFVITTGEIWVWHKVGDSWSRNTAVMLLTFAGTSVLDPKYAATIVRGALLVVVVWYTFTTGPRYIRDAISNSYLATFPILFGVALYSWIHGEPRTFNDWLVVLIEDSFYYVGCVMMMKQLLINYRLQSVPRFPMKLFVYKIIATFADDAFAWLAETPLKYRLMTLRDDVVFVVFLYQWWAYRVDAARPHEYWRFRNVF